MFLLVAATMAIIHFLPKLTKAVPSSLVAIIGVVISALAFAWESAKRIRARKYLDADGVKHYEFYGPLFFGSVGLFQEKFDIRNDPAEIVIDFKESRIVDHSAIEAINKVTERYSRAGKKLHLRHLSEDCRALLDNASSLIEINHWEDPRYTLPVDQLEASAGKSKKASTGKAVG